MKKIVLVVVVLTALIVLAIPAFRTGPGEMPVTRTAVEVSEIRIACRAYLQEFGAFPSGAVTTVCRSLAGENPRSICFIQFPKDHRATDGSFLDAWGTPYRIDFEGTNLVIASAGKDRRWGTKDDIRKE
jgi:hypothetical protein